MNAEKFIEDMKGRGIIKQEGNFSPLIFGAIPPGGFAPFMTKYYSFDFRAFLFTFREGHGTIFFDPVIYQNCTREGYKHFIKNGEKSFLELEDFKKLSEKINQLYLMYPLNKLEKLSKEELVKLIRDFFKLNHEILAATVFSEALDELIVKEFFNETNNNVNFEEFTRISFQAGSESFALRSDKVIIDNANNRDFYRLQYIFADYNLVPSLKEIEENIKKIILERGGIKGIQKNYKSKIKELKEINKKIRKYKKSLPENLQKLLDFIQLTILVRDTRKVPLQKLACLLCNTAEVIFKRLGLNTEDKIYLMVNDFEKDKPLSEDYAEEIKNRKTGFVLYYNKKETSFEYGNVEDAKRKLYKVIDGISSEVTELKGSIGCKGYAKGVVKIILSHKDFNKFKEGEILVTSMTRTEFVPLMKKAIAVITDEGGITCHAAIISRELGIPCVIGTKNATRVLKDGDEVEVDADKGIVRIIKNQNYEQS